MSERDELVSKLRSWNHCWPAPWLEGAVAVAADQIERDGREIERLTAENERLREALVLIREASKFWAGDVTGSDAVRYAHESMQRLARATLERKEVGDV